MKHTAKRRLINRICSKLSDKQGFSLGELLAATVILLLASQVMAQGIGFATRMYNETLSRSHAKQLCSTLTNTIETELRYTTSISTTGMSADGSSQLTAYFSPVYGQTLSGFLMVDSDDNEVTGAPGGEIAIRVTDRENQVVIQRLISSASYSSYELKVEVQNVTYNTAANTFSATLKINDKNGNELVASTFNVIPVNKLKINE